MPIKTNFRLFQLKDFADVNFKSKQKWQKVLKKNREHCEKGRNCSLQATSAFPTVFSKDLYGRQVKTRACLGKG